MSNTSVISAMSVESLLSAFVADAGNAAESLVRDYRAADKGTKATIRKNADKAFDSAFKSVISGDMDMAVAAAIKSAMSELTSVPEKAPVDPNVEVRTLVRNYLDAAIALMSGEATFSGNTDNMAELVEWDDVLISNLSDVRNDCDFGDIDTETVERLATVRIGRKSRENDIPPLVREAFENVPEGTFLKVSDIRARIASNHPELDISVGWDGRINAALFVNNDASGVDGLISVGGPKKVNRDEWVKYGKNGAIRAF